MPRMPIEMSKPINVPDALDLVETIFDEAIASGRHQPGDWRELGLTGNGARLYAHFHGWDDENWGFPPKDEDHLANLCCRALMLLQLRLESAAKVKP